jgi:predicted RNA polymerase sigma factor
MPQHSLRSATCVPGKAYERALALTSNAVERRYLRSRMVELESVEPA